MDQKKMQVEKVTGQQSEALMDLPDLPDDLKMKIRAKYFALVKKHPDWKRHRAMRKAGEAYNVQFKFVA